MKTHLRQDFDKLFKSFKSCSLQSPTASNHLNNVHSIQSNCSIHSVDKILSFCPQLKKLGWITLDHTLQSSNKLKQLTEHSSIEYLGIQCKFPFEIETPTFKIKQLWIPEAQTYYLPKINIQFPHLIKLFLDGTLDSLRDKSTGFDLIKSLAEMKSLKELSLDYYHFNDKAIKDLSKLDQLHKLSFDSCVYDNIKNTIILPLNLKEISLTICSRNKKSIIKFFSVVCQQKLIISLKLYLWGLTALEQQILRKQILKHHFLLKSVWLSIDCSLNFIEITGKNTHEMQQFQWIINSGYKQQVNLKIGKEILISQKQLKKLNLSNCQNLEDKSLIVITEFKNLKQLILNNCNLRNRGAIYLKKMKTLEILDLEDNLFENKISIQIMSNLKRTWKLILNNKSHLQSKKFAQNIFQLRYFI